MLIFVFICVAVLNISPVSSQGGSDNYVPCERGWYYFRGKCYKAGGASERYNWDGALARCKRWGANLVSIQSQEEQDFVIAFLQLDFKYWFWTGLNDRETEGDYKWSDGSVFNFTDWKKNEPSGPREESEDCVHIVFEPAFDIVGKWNDRACDVLETYVCEMNANPRRRSPNLMYCPGGGWKYESSCYHVVTEMKSWQNAEKHCQDNYNGHLVTIRDTLEDYFLNYILENMEKEVWIGIKTRNQLQQKWSSGWYVSYDGFNKEEMIFAEGTCIARKSRKDWIKVPCSRQLPFICETSKANPPVLKPPPRGSHCPTDLEDWRDLGGDYCYYFETKKNVNFYEASFDCKRRGGDLVSIHSKEEAEILRPFVEYAQFSIGPSKYYIGLFRLLANEAAFAWTDGSPIDYERWNSNEPNSEEERCVEALTNDMGWNDMSCEDKRGYICSVKKISSNLSTEETIGCASHVPLNALIGVAVCIILLIIFLGVVMYYFRPCSTIFRKNSTATSPVSPSPSTISSIYMSSKELTLKDDNQYEIMT